MSDKRKIFLDGMFKLSEIKITDMTIETNCTGESINNVQEYLDCSKIMFERRLNSDKMVESAVFEDFILHKTIGMGTFGRVLLVNHKSNGKKFLAMKVSTFVKLNSVFLRTIHFICHSTDFFKNFPKTHKNTCYDG